LLDLPVVTGSINSRSRAHGSHFRPFVVAFWPSPLVPLRTRERKRERKGQGTSLSHFATESIRVTMTVTLLPADEWRPSTITERRLCDLVSEGLLHLVTLSTRLEWIAPPGEDQEPHPLEGYVVSFVKFHRHRLGSPYVGSCGWSFIITASSSSISPPTPFQMQLSSWWFVKGT